MPSAKEMSAASTAPYVWSDAFNSAYDSPTGRWLAFGALNRLGREAMRQLWRGRLLVAQPFFMDSIVQRTKLWPPWLSNHFDTNAVRFCRGCARQGYHSVFHQLPLLKSCPWHGIELSSACLHCGYSHAIRGSIDYPQADCLKCRAGPFPGNAERYARTPAFLAREQEAFGAMGRALSACRAIMIRAITETVEQYPLTSPPSPGEILSALAATGRLPIETVAALQPDPLVPVDATIVPFPGARGGSGGWRRALTRFRETEESCPKSVPSADDLRLIGFNGSVERHCRRLLQHLVDGSGVRVRPPSSDAYWTLALRAYWHDRCHNPSYGPRCVATSLRDRLLIKVPGHDAEWLVLRTTAEK